MSISSINSIDTNLYTKKLQSAASTSTCEELIYDKNSLNADTVEFYTLKDSQNTSLKDELQNIKEEQGLIGKAWDGIKNFFNMKSGSKSVENTIEQYEKGEISQEAAKEALEKYKEGQKMCTDVTADITSGIIAVGAAALAPVTGGASLLVAAGAGAVSKTAIKAADAAIGGREYDLKDLGYDLTTGSINGAIAPLSNALGGAAGTTVAKACGLNAVQTSAKSAGKGIIAGLLAKQGTSYIAQEGTKLSAGLVAAKVLSYGTDMAIDGALSGAADGFSRALGEGRLEDIKDDTLNGALGGLIAAPVIGGSTRLVFKGASSLGSKLFSEADDTITSNIAKAVPVFENVDEALDYLNNSTNPKAKDILKSYNKLTQSGQKVSLQRLQGAIGLMDDAFSEEKIATISRELASQYSDDASMRRTMSELFDVLGIDSETVYDPNKKIYITQSDYGTITARAKGEQSISPKIRNKIFDLREDFPTDKNAANSMIGDAQGTRIVAKNSSITTDEIEKIVRANTDNPDDIELFTKYILENKGTISEDKMPLLKNIEKQVYDSAREAQSGKLIANLAKAVENGDIQITELHNYSGAEGIAYFSDSQVDTLKEAYTNWYEKMLKIAKENPNNSQYQIVNKNNLVCLQDKNGHIFEPSMLIESVSNSKKAVKGTGYSAAQMNIITKDGIQEELQYRGTLTDEISELEHVPYDIKKNKDTVLRPEYDFIRSIFNKYKNNENFDVAYNKYLSDTYKAYRRMELGLSADVPNIEDYLGAMLSEKEMQAISFSGLEKLHDFISRIDKQKAA